MLVDIIKKVNPETETVAPHTPPPKKDVKESGPALEKLVGKNAAKNRMRKTKGKK